MAKEIPAGALTDLPIVKRFAEALQIESNGCWTWMASKTKGYGSFWFRHDGQPHWVRAHRFAYVAFKGAIPDGLELDHLCRNRACVNPTHLEPVTRQVNLQRSPFYNGRKTHCVRGHAFDEANTYVRRDRPWLTRECRACRHDDTKRWAAKRAAGPLPPSVLNRRTGKLVRLLETRAAKSHECSRCGAAILRGASYYMARAFAPARLCLECGNREISRVRQLAGAPA